MDADVRQALLRAANSVLGESGPEALSVGAVADRAGVDIATFHAHFAGRADILGAVAGDTLAALVDFIDELSTTIGDPAESTSVATRVLVGLALNDPEFAAALLRRGDLGEQFDALITPGAVRVFAAGIASGRFCISDPALAVRMALASTYVALQAVASGLADHTAGPRAAAWLLRALGVTEAEAWEIAHRPLPALPVSRWGRAEGAATSPEAESVDVAPSVDATLDADESVVLQQRRDGGVLHLVLNRPGALNALDFRLGRELRDALRLAAEDASVRCVVLSGAGRSFCSGWDVRSPGEAAPGESVVPDIVNPIIEAIRSMPKPVVAMVQGAAAGVGCSLALAADLVVAARSSSFLLAFARIGLSGDGGATALLPARVGLGRAARMMMLAEPMSAPEALASGLVEQLVEDDSLDEAATALAHRLAVGPTRSYAATKQLLTLAALPELSTHLEREGVVAEQLVASEDYAEGRRAFGEKRLPEFSGR